MRTNVTPNAVQDIYQQFLGRKGQSQYINNWVNSGMSLDEIRTAVEASKEGQQYADSNSTNVNPNMGNVTTVDDSGMAGVNPISGQQAPIDSNAPVRDGRGGTVDAGTNPNDASPIPDTAYTPPPTAAEVNALYQQFLGRDGKPEYIQAWIDTGQDLSQLANSIKNSVEGLEYAASGGGQGGTESVETVNNTNPNQSVLDAIKAQQAAYQAQQQAMMDQLAAQQQAQQTAQQELFTQYGQSAKGGTNQQQKPMFAGGDGTGNMTGETGIQPPSPYGQNPYSTGYGMGYQTPGMASQYMPQTGMLGPSGFGGYGGYSPYGGGKGGGYAPIMPQRPMMGKGGGYSTGIMPNNSGAMVPGAPDDAVIPPPVIPPPIDTGASASALTPALLEESGTAPLTGGARPSAPPADPVPQTPVMSDDTGFFPPSMMPPPMYSPYGGKGGYRQPMYQQPMYQQPMYQQPMYQPRGGYYGGGYYR